MRMLMQQQQQQRDGQQPPKVSPSIILVLKVVMRGHRCISKQCRLACKLAARCQMAEGRLKQNLCARSLRGRSSRPPQTRMASWACWASSGCRIPT